jgi:hypothetical protein
MMKATIFATLGLAAVLALATPPRANAGVVVGVGVGPVFVRPASGYIVVPPRPYFYYQHPYAYGYAYGPGYGYPGYRYYGRFDRDRRWDRRDRDYDRHEYGERGYRR